MSGLSNLSASAESLAKSVHAALGDDLALKNTLGDPARLYDDAPDDPIFPYLTYGPLRSEDRSADETALGNHKLTLNVWSRYMGRAEVFEILTALEQALTREAVQAQSTANIVMVQVLYADVLRAVDGRTRRGILRLSITQNI